MGMRWEDERYVRLYTRNTATWVALGWEGRFVLMSLLRQVDRAGLLDLEPGEEAKSVADLIQAPLEVVTIGLTRMLDRGVVVIEESDLGSDPRSDLAGRRSDLAGRRSAEDPIAIRSRSSKLVWPNFILAQETPTSDRERKRKSRELASIGHGLSREVTPGHAPSHLVTPSRAVLSRAVPSLNSIADPIPVTAVTDRIKPLKMRLLADYETKRGRTYTWGGSRDTEALKALLPIATDDEIAKRWGEQLDEGSSTISNLARQFITPKPIQPELPGTPPKPPPPPRALSRQGNLFSYFHELRAESYAEHGTPFEADEDLPPQFYNGAFLKIIEACEQKSVPVESVIEAYFNSPNGAALKPKDGFKSVKYPFRYFASQWCWPRLLAEVDAKFEADEAKTPSKPPASNGTSASPSPSSNTSPNPAGPEGEDF